MRLNAIECDYRPIVRCKYEINETEILINKRILKLKQTEVVSVKNGRNLTESDTFRLTPVSRRLYRELINPDNVGLTVSELCDKAKVSRETYYQRMRDDEFVRKVRKEQSNLIKANIGNVLNATYKYALEEKGHQDRKMLLTWAGEYADKTETKIEGEVDIGSTSSILQKYLKSEDDEPVADEDGG